MSLRVLLLVTGALALQARANATIDAAQRRQILQTPNGLKTLAGMSGGHFSFDADPDPVSVLYDLRSAAKASSLILNGTVKSLSAHLSADGDDIVTSFIVHPEQLLKGSALDDITLQIRGGKVTFDNGDTAEINTLPVQHLSVGHSYLLFLNKVDGPTKNENAYAPLGSYQTIIDTSSQDSLIPLAKFDAHLRSPLLAEISKYFITTPNDLILRIQYLLSEL